MILIGRRIYGVGVVALGVVEGLYGAFSPDWLTVPPHMPGYHLLAELAAAVLIIAGVAINLPRVAGIGALAASFVFVLGMVVLEAPHLLTKPMNWGGWQAVAESTAMAVGGWLALALTPGVDLRRAAIAGRTGQWVFAACILVFGASHFVYAKLTASLVPAWLPPSQLIWAYLTGAAQIAAGLAILSSVQARVASVLLTIMYALFSLLVHLPSIIAAPRSHDSWVENAINLTLVGVAWALADFLAQAKPRR